MLVDGQTCSTAQFLCGYVMDGYEGSLSAAETPGIQPENFCGTSSAENIRWYSFSTCEEDVTIEILHTGCSGGILPTQGFQAGIYSSCNFDEDFLTCETNTMVNGMITLTFSSPPGIHYLFLDGFAGSVCDYSITVVEGINTTPIDSTTYIGSDITPPDSLSCGTIEGPNGIGDQEGCTLGTATFTVVASSGTFSADLSPVDLDSLFCIDSPLESGFADDFFCLTWHIDPPFGYNLLSDTVYQVPYGQWDPDDYPLILEWTSTGLYHISYSIQTNPNIPSCLGLGFSIDCGSNGISVNVSGPDIIQLPPDTICEGDSYPFCGQLHYETAVLSCGNIETCELEQQPLYVIPRIEEQLGTKYVCADDCFEVYGSTYCMPGNYSVGGASNCDTFYLFTIADLSLDLTILGDTTITCSTTSVNLSASVVTNFTDGIDVSWTGPIGQPIPTNPDGSITVSDPGIYTATATPEELEDCAVSVTTTVAKDDAVPVLNDPDLTRTCAQPSVTLFVTSSEPIATYDWSGPNGFTSNTANPLVNEAGTYTVVVLAENGCTAETTLQVIDDTSPPTVTLTYADLNCAVESSVASFSSTAAVSQTWTTPTGSTTNTPTITYTEEGTYQLSIESANGCVLDTTFTISDHSYTPTLDLPSDTLWRCSTVQISYPISAPPHWLVTWTTANGLTDIVEETLLALRPGTYYAAITDATLGCSAVDTVVIELDTDTLALQYDIQDPTCYAEANGSAGLTIFSGQPPYTYTLDGKMVDSTDLATLAAGTYHIAVADAYGCQVNGEVTLVDPLEVIITSPEVVNIGFQPDLSLAVDYTIDEADLASVEWYSEEGTLIYTGNPYNLNGLSISPMYGVKVTDIAGCADSTGIRFELDYEIDLHVPNIFSPNGDGINDRWFISSAGFPSVIEELGVYDRWGNKVYSASTINYNNADQGWDGSMDGTACTPGVYVYVVSYLQADGLLVTKTGSITLVL